MLFFKRFFFKTRCLFCCLNLKHFKSLFIILFLSLGEILYFQKIGVKKSKFEETYKVDEPPYFIVFLFARHYDVKYEKKNSISYF